MRRYRLPAPTTFRDKAARPSIKGARLVSFALVGTALYGDLLKRVMPGTGALISLYAIAGCIILVMHVLGRRRASGTLPVISALAGALMLTYLMQFFTGFDVDLLPALMMLIYVCVPLSFLVVIPQVFRQFDIRAVAIYTAILMVPLHAVGLVQQFVDSSFMVSSVYSESGGVIARNFLEGTEAFNRMPSLFASADRYAGVSAAQVLLALVLLRGSSRDRLILCLSITTAALGLMIAGSRSRILIVLVALLAGGMAFLFKMSQGRINALGRTWLVRGALVGALLLAAALSIPDVKDRLMELPILTMLTQTAEKGDAQIRFQESFEISIMPGDVKFFGDGLGTSADGRPGEFGIRAMWIEGGFFWTSIMLMIHLGILAWFAVHLFRATVKGDAILSVILTGCGLFWLFGVLAGLSSSFELSLALLLFPMMAIAAMASTEPTQRRNVPREWRRAWWS